MVAVIVVAVVAVLICVAAAFADKRSHDIVDDPNFAPSDRPLTPRRRGLLSMRGLRREALDARQRTDEEDWRRF